MKTLGILFVHNRPRILQECLSTLFNNNELMFDEFLIINDNSKRDLTLQLNAFAIDHKFNVVNFNKGVGYANAFDFALSYLEWRNPKYVFIIEQDYIFSKNGLDRVLDIFENTEVGQNAIAFSGYNNPDWFNKDKRSREFPQIQLNNFNEDLIKRDLLWKPWEIDTKYGKTLLQYVSNSCGTMYIDWSKVMEVRNKYYPLKYEEWRNKVVDKHKSTNRNLNDGALSGGLGNLHSIWADYSGKVDRFKFGGILCDLQSVANHINGGGFDPELGENSSINGHIIPEGQSFTGSPTWGMNLDEIKTFLKQINY